MEQTTQESLRVTRPDEQRTYWEIKYHVPLQGLSPKAVRSLICRIAETYIFGGVKGEPVSMHRDLETLNPLSEDDYKRFKPGDALTFRIQGPKSAEKHAVETLKEILENELRNGRS